LEKEYPITWNLKKGGKATVDRAGMFVMIKCKCELNMLCPLRIVLCHGNKKLDLGQCINYQDGIGLKKRISIKEITPENIYFQIEPALTEMFIPIQEDSPFPAIDQLKHGRFAVVGDQKGIYLPEDISISMPTGQ